MQGIRMLILTTEQGLGDLKRAILRVHGDANGDLPQPNGAPTFARFGKGPSRDS